MLRLPPLETSLNGDGKVISVKIPPKGQTIPADSLRNTPAKFPEGTQPPSLRQESLAPLPAGLAPYASDEAIPAEVLREMVQQEELKALLQAIKYGLHDVNNAFTAISLCLQTMVDPVDALCQLEPKFCEVTPIESLEGRKYLFEHIQFRFYGLHQYCDSLIDFYNKTRREVDVYAKRDVMTFEGLLEAANLRELHEHYKGLIDDMNTLLRNIEDVQCQRAGELEYLPDIKADYEKSLSRIHNKVVTMRDAAVKASEILKAFFRMEEAGEPRARLKSCMTLDEMKVFMGDDISVEVDFLEQEHRMEVSSTDLWRLFVNLLTNSRQAMQKTGGSLTVVERCLSLDDERSIRELKHDFMPVPPHPGRYLVIKLRDTGPGIPKALLEKMGTVSFSTKGSTGLGLGSIAEMVKKAGGFIGINSRTDEEEHGTTFSIYLPVENDFF